MGAASIGRVRHAPDRYAWLWVARLCGSALAASVAFGAGFCWAQRLELRMSA